MDQSINQPNDILTALLRAAERHESSGLHHWLRVCAGLKQSFVFISYHTLPHSVDRNKAVAHPSNTKSTNHIQLCPTTTSRHDHQPHPTIHTNHTQPCTTTTPSHVYQSHPAVSTNHTQPCPPTTPNHVHPPHHPAMSTHHTTQPCPPITPLTTPNHDHQPHPDMSTHHTTHPCAPTTTPTTPSHVHKPHHQLRHPAMSTNYITQLSPSTTPPMSTNYITQPCAAITPPSHVHPPHPPAMSSHHTPQPCLQPPHPQPCPALTFPDASTPQPTGMFSPFLSLSSILPRATAVVAMSSTMLSPLLAGAATEIGLVPRVGCK